MLHPSSEEFLWYTRAGIAMSLQEWPSERAKAFEAHVAECPECAVLLAQEADAELLLYDLADEQHGTSRPRIRPWMYATAAALTLFIVIGARGSFAAQPQSSNYSHESATVSLDAGILLADGDILPSQTP
tara:strand:+ start:76658 stop:77047 length:390 start_codon:yes stop_codon:yes gene_type:complete